MAICQQNYFHIFIINFNTTDVITVTYILIYFYYSIKRFMCFNTYNFYCYNKSKYRDGLAVLLFQLQRVKLKSRCLRHFCLRILSLLG